MNHECRISINTSYTIECIKETYDLIKEFDYNPLAISYNKEFDLNGFVFDTKFVEYSTKDTDSGAMVIFRMVKGNNQLFLHLFNVHNGYYGHGFDTNLPCGNGCL